MGLSKSAVIVYGIKILIKQLAENKICQLPYYDEFYSDYPDEVPKLDVNIFVIYTEGSDHVFIGHKSCELNQYEESCTFPDISDKFKYRIEMSIKAFLAFYAIPDEELDMENYLVFKVW